MAPHHLNSAPPFEGTLVIKLSRPQRPQPPEKAEPSIVATLDLARALAGEMESEGISQTELAKRHGLTGARVCQLLNLLRLPAATLEHIESLRGQPLGARYLTERILRPRNSPMGETAADALEMKPGGHGGPRRKRSER
jgi:hypothetical protein